MPKPGCMSDLDTQSLRVYNSPSILALNNVKDFVNFYFYSNEVEGRVFIRKENVAGKTWSNI